MARNFWGSILGGMIFAAFIFLGFVMPWIPAQDQTIKILRATIVELEQKVIMTEWERDFWKERADTAHRSIAHKKLRIVEVTAYSATKEQCDNDPHIAASMKPPKPGTVAVSRDLFDLGWTFGKTVYLKGLGPYVINDVMNERFKHRVDVFISDTRQAKGFGTRTTEAILLRG